jgi:uncharacterized protein
MSVIEEVKTVQPAKSKLKVIDCDIHPALRSASALAPYLPKQWQDHLRDFGIRARDPLNGRAYPPITPALSRQDSWPENGGPPGSDLNFMRKQHLDEMGVECGVLQPLNPSGREERNPDFGAAVCRAMNEWQVAEWTSQEPRLRASICVPAEDAGAAVEEIALQAKRKDFVQIFMNPRLREPIGSRRYWPVYEAAVEYDLPIGLHVGGNTGIPTTASGWPSTYGENHFDQSTGLQVGIANMILEGVFAKFPKLKVVVVEGGLAWVSGLGSHLDYYWSRLRQEVPYLKVPPSEYLKNNIWFTTQPMDEPENRLDMVDVFESVGWDRLLFSSDYPHWDGDDPNFAFPATLPKDKLHAILFENARHVYPFGTR